MWSEAKNERRIELLCRKHTGESLTNAEWAELDRLQYEAEEALPRVSQEDFERLKELLHD